MLNQIKNLAKAYSTLPTTKVATIPEVATPKGDSQWPDPRERALALIQSAAQIGDSHIQNGDSPATPADPKGDSPSGRATHDGDLVTKKVDSVASESPEKRRLIATALGDFRATSAHTMGDSPPRVATNLSNVNVTLLEFIKNVNVNVREVASYLCQIFGENPQHQGYYLQLARQHSNPQAWLGALLETLFAQQRGSIRNSGGYFSKRCVALHRELPTETTQLVERFSTYTYAQIQEHLRGSGTTSQANSSSQQPATETRKASAQPEVTLNIPRDEQHPGMSEEALTRVLQHVADNMMSYRLQTIPYRQQDGTYSLLLADYVKHQRWIYTPQEWQETYARLCQTRRLKDIFTMPQ